MGALFTAWEVVNQDTSEENIHLLFKHFKKVQKSEVDLTTKTIDPVEAPLLMDNLCKVSKTDQGIMSLWKNFVENSVFNIAKDDELQPVEISALKLPITHYRKFFQIRDTHTENQIEKKVILLREHVEKFVHDSLT